MPIEFPPCTGCGQHIPATNGCNLKAHGLPCVYERDVVTSQIPPTRHEQVDAAFAKGVIDSEKYQLAQASANAEMRRALDRLEPVPDATTYGVKFDDGKLRYDLIPAEAVEGLARVLTFGAKKYAPRNWEKGMSWGRVFGALMRHLWAWWRGEDKDPETGFSHLDHAACCIAFLQTYEVRRIGADDRVKPCKPD